MRHRENVNGEFIEFTTTENGEIKHNDNKTVAAVIYLAAAHGDPRFEATFNRNNLGHPTVTHTPIKKGR